MLGSKKKILDRKKCGSENNFVLKKNFMQKNVGFKKCFVFEKNLGPQKNFGSKKNFVFKNLVVVVALFVTWVLRTHYPLNPAKSPWVDYVSNFRFVVQPLLIDFGLGDCCCCDRGKTKSTPSPKTEVLTWDWSLTKEIYITGVGLVFTVKRTNVAWKKYTTTTVSSSYVPNH